MKIFYFLNIICFLVIEPSFSQPGQTPVKLEFITQIPPVLTGCLGLYTYDTTSLQRKSYIMVSNLQELAFIKVGGHEIKLAEENHKKLSNSMFRITYKAGEYIVILITKTGNEVGAMSTERGTIEVIKGNTRKVFKIHGEAGCK